MAIKDDAKDLKNEYVKGASIVDLAAKYGYSEQEVYNTVVSEATAEPVVTQALEDAQVTSEPVKEDPKKEK